MLLGYFQLESQVLFLGSARAFFGWHAFFRFSVGASPGPRGTASAPVENAAVWTRPYTPFLGKSITTLPKSNGFNGKTHACGLSLA